METNTVPISPEVDLAAGARRGAEYIFLLHEAKFVKYGQPVYKIGRILWPDLRQFEMRGDGGNLLLHLICRDSRECERRLIQIFRAAFVQQGDIGDGRFMGNYVSMISLISEVVVADLDDCRRGRWVAENDGESVGARRKISSNHGGSGDGRGGIAKPVKQKWGWLANVTAPWLADPVLSFLESVALDKFDLLGNRFWETTVNRYPIQISSDNSYRAFCCWCSEVQTTGQAGATVTKGDFLGGLHRIISRRISMPGDGGRIDGIEIPSREKLIADLRNCGSAL
jgi:hypothetical protein